ncbi:hypothetical protein CDAR_19021 [Caerostris darwini]|uniref:Uncharacterized protein n=1 Tax=Caerostris darwini TaxID=1538125 RepID=A0AAV4WBN0_9ARAC|nr:hypothetical protein CDAR_19021 [Caerostris darwini]
MWHFPLPDVFLGEHLPFLIRVPDLLRDPPVFPLTGLRLAERLLVRILDLRRVDRDLLGPLQSCDHVFRIHNIAHLDYNEEVPVR